MQPARISRRIFYGVIAFFSTAALIVLYFVVNIFTSMPNANFTVNDTGVLHGEMVCMANEDSLHRWQDHANQNDDLAMRLAFADSGVAMLHGGDRVNITELGKDTYRVKLSGGQQCWLPGGILDKP